jgi:hypothetical protein
MTKIWTALALDVPVVFSGTVEVKWMRPTSVEPGETNQWYGIPEPKEGEAPRNNWDSALSAGMVRYEQRLSRVSAKIRSFR